MSPSRRRSFLARFRPRPPCSPPAAATTTPTRDDTHDRPRPSSTRLVLGRGVRPQQPAGGRHPAAGAVPPVRGDGRARAFADAPAELAFDARHRGRARSNVAHATATTSSGPTTRSSSRSRRPASTPSRPRSTGSRSRRRRRQGRRRARSLRSATRSRRRRRRRGRSRSASGPSAPASRPCPFHEVSLADVLAAGRPSVVMISTPAYCQTRSAARCSTCSSPRRPPSRHAAHPHRGVSRAARQRAVPGRRADASAWLRAGAVRCRAPAG